MTKEQINHKDDSNTTAYKFSTSLNPSTTSRGIPKFAEIIAKYH